MPGLIQEGGPFKTIRVKELHPTFGAEIEGVDFPNPSEEQFKELLAAMAKVGPPRSIRPFRTITRLALY
jgi:alpha-ketoglutarate-dependent 2,4-dichlorophenoxyacetate dioxygenase